MKKLCIITSTRADYGLLKNIIRKAKADSDLHTSLVVTGSHLSSDFGNTVQEIERDGIVIDKRIDIQDRGDSEAAVCQTMARALTSFAEYFERCRPDMVMLLGDRYEICAIACAAFNFRIPIAHLHGGEITEGAVDEAFRHSITKMSYLHFTSTEEYRNRVIQLGEDPERVYYVGSTGIENIRLEQLMTKEELSASIGIDLSKKYAVATFHPVTLDEDSAEKQCEELIQACKSYEDIIFIFTKANADAGGKRINALLEKYALICNNIYLVDSLGHIRYLSALQHAAFVIGNSSSGIVEAPSFNIPTVNIGKRQKGRIRAASIIDVEPETDKIRAAIEHALQLDCTNVTNPQEKENTSSVIVETVKEYLTENKIDLMKKFYDINR